jgi:hypothetical protein
MSGSNIKKNALVVLTLIFLLAVNIRLIHFDSITFFYDQARDAFESLGILAKGDIKIIGPSTDIQGLRHGPLYWYLLSPIYYFTNGSVYAVRLFLILLGSCSVFIMYFLTKLLTKNRELSYITAFVIAFSFEAVQYSRWLSNPAPAFLTISIFWSGLWLINKNSKYGLPLSLLGLFLSIQFQLFLLYLFGFLIMLLIFKFFKKELSNIFIFDKQTLPIYVFAFLFSSTFIIAEIKFKFLGTTSLVNHFLHGNSNGTSFLSKINSFPLSLIDNFKNNFSLDTIFVFIFLLFLVISNIYLFFKEKNSRSLLFFLWMWILSPLIVHFLSGYFAYFTNIGNTFPLIILTIYTGYQLLISVKLKNLIYPIVALLAIFNIQKVLNTNMNGETLFAIQNKMIVSDETRVVDWIYNDSMGKEFALNSVTNPLFINTTWAYLFNWYGKQKYHYLPTWWGYPQNDQPGGDILSYKRIPIGNYLYLIIEPIGGIPEYYPRGYKALEDGRSKLLEIKKIGSITIEKRQILNYNSFPREDLMKAINNLDK